MAGVKGRFLRCNDLLFINEYLANGRNATRAYQKVHPKCSYNVAKNRGWRVVAKDCVQQELHRRIQHDAGITREGIESSLLTYKGWAEACQDYEAAAAIAMDCARLGGFLVEKRENVTENTTQLTDEQLWSELESRLLEHKMSDNVKSVKSPAEIQKSDSVPSESHQDDR